MVTSFRTIPTKIGTRIFRQSRTCDAPPFEASRQFEYSIKVVHLLLKLLEYQQIQLLAQWFVPKYDFFQIRKADTI